MTFRLFFLTLALMTQLPAAWAAPVVRSTTDLVPGEPVRAMWLSFPYWDLPLEKKKIFAAYLAKNHINKVYLSVYDNGFVRWNSRVLAENGMAEAQSDEVFAESIEIFRSNGIKVAAFFESGLSVFLNQPFVNKRPDLLLRCNIGRKSAEHGGNLMAWLDPWQKESRELVLKALEELASHKVGFDEIMLDRFRYTHGAKFEICKSADGSTNPAYVNELVRQAYVRIKKVNPKIVVSASPVGSYGYWKLGQRWGAWAQGGYIDQIATQAYVMPPKITDCRAGTPMTPARRRALAIFKGELASVTGQPALLEEAARELKQAGGNPVADLDLKNRLPMVRVRQQELDPKKLPHPVPILMGYSAFRFDDSECVADEIKLAQKLGYTDTILWVSAVSPNDDGSPNREIDDNLSLLGATVWRNARP